MPKKIGILGGMSPESTIEYYGVVQNRRILLYTFFSALLENPNLMLIFA